MNLGFFDEYREAKAARMCPNDGKQRAIFSAGANWARDHLKIISDGDKAEADRLRFELKVLNDKLSALMMESID